MDWLPFLIIDGHRSRRVAELLSILWILALADLLFTLWAHFFTPFHELNPVAGYMLNNNLIPSLIAFKLGVTGIGTNVFWRVRHHGRAELALWAIVGVYVMLLLRWSAYTTFAMTATSVL